MPLFQKRMSTSPWQTAVLGDRIDFEVTREFHVEAIIIECGWTTGTVSATTATDKGGAMVKKLSVQTNDGQNNRTVVSASGMALIQQFANECGNIGADTRAALVSGTTTVGSYRAFFPYYFAPPQMADPARSAFLLPAPRFNTNIQVSIEVPTRADVDSNVSPTFVVSALQYRVHVVRRVVDVASWVTFDQEFKEISHDFASTGDDQIHELDVPGSYSSIMARFYNRTTNPTYLPLSSVFAAGNTVRLQALDTTFVNIGYTALATINESTMVGLTTNGATQTPLGNHLGSNTLYFDFLTDGNGSSVRDLGSVLDANPYVATGSRIKLMFDFASANLAKISSRRLFGDLSSLKMNKKGK